MLKSFHGICPRNYVLLPHAKQETYSQIPFMFNVMHPWSLFSMLYILELEGVVWRVAEQILCRQIPPLETSKNFQITYIQDESRKDKNGYFLIS